MNVLSYSEKNLASSLANKYTSIDFIKSKNHFSYLNNYLQSPEIGAKTIVIEENYISKDFLDDFSSYYAQCHSEYSKYCKRVHFFSVSITSVQFSQALINQYSDVDIWKYYIGFIVVKPIPETVIGYTVLKTYIASKTKNNRVFWGTREYQIHLFGHKIKLKSLAFQEQDSVLSKCATTAIWSMLNKASIDHRTILKSSSEITKDAGNFSYNGSRLFPNTGLNVLQICQSITNSGLVTEIKEEKKFKPNHDLLPFGRPYVISNEYLKKIINAYSPIGIPIILIVFVPNDSRYGLHAITISGHSKAPFVKKEQENKLRYLSNNIEKLYAHDDQFGPFVRINFHNDAILETPWGKISGDKESYVSQILVPLYPKIRITFEDIELVVVALHAILTSFFMDKISSDVSWDIKLEYSENLKNDLQKNPYLSDTFKINKLQISTPKYVWIASSYIDKEKIIDFIFDATNINTSMFGFDVYCYMGTESISVLAEDTEQNKNWLITLINSKNIAYIDFITEKLRLHL
jgi:hypothetical protein